MFENEASDYLTLKDCEEVIPKCYGGYTVKFPDRELDEDKNINLILVEKINGKRLNELPVWETTDVQKKQIRNQVIGIMEKLNARGILLPEVSAKQFILQQHSGKLFVTDFTGSIHGGGELRATKYRQDESVRELFSEIGYVSVSE